MKRNDKSIKDLTYLLNNLVQDTDIIEKYGNNYPVRLNPKNIEGLLPYMVFLTLVNLLDFNYFGNEEKILWSIPVKYKNIPFLISHRKFGLSLETLELNSGVSDLAVELIGILVKAMKITDRSIKPIIEEEVLKGNFGLVNHYINLVNRYNFFRYKAYESFNTPVSKISDSLTSSFQQFFASRSEGFFYAQSMVDAYFSCLEHILVLLLPFVGFDSTNEDIKDLIGYNWTDKYNRIFAVDKDKQAKNLYQKIREIKETYRNTMSHGGLEKEGKSLYVHFPVIGGIPLHLSKFGKSVHYSLFPIEDDTFDNIVAVFDEFDKFLDSSTVGLAIRYIKSGLPINFHQAVRLEYEAAMKSSEK